MHVLHILPVGGFQNNSHRPPQFPVSIERQKIIKQTNNISQLEFSLTIGNTGLMMRTFKSMSVTKQSNENSAQRWAWGIYHLWYVWLKELRQTFPSCNASWSFGPNSCLTAPPSETDIMLVSLQRSPDSEGKGLAPANRGSGCPAASGQPRSWTPQRVIVFLNKVVVLQSSNAFLPTFLILLLTSTEMLDFEEGPCDGICYRGLLRFWVQTGWCCRALSVQDLDRFESNSYVPVFSEYGQTILFTNPSVRKKCK